MVPPDAKMPSRNDARTTTCPVCGRGVVRVGRRRFCTDACRQAAWRQRHPAQPPAVPARLPQASIIYECPLCLTRFLGEQRCGEYQRFCRRVGPGGPCPHCDEPVAVTDLIPREGR
jgi:hypothetical protein